MMNALPYSLKYSGGPLLLALLSCTLWLFEPASGQLFAYERSAIEQMEWWRVLSGNIVHTNGFHLLLNLGGLVLLWALHGEHYRPLRFLHVIVWCSVLTGLGLYAFNTELHWYAGLSGTLHGLFTWGACMDVKHGFRSGFALLVGIAVKIGWEQAYGASDGVASLIDANVAVNAHLFGAIAGLIVFAVMGDVTAKKLSASR